MHSSSPHNKHVPYLMSVSTTVHMQSLLQAQAITKRLNSTHTNYGFCKNLTEQMLAGFHNKPFPVCINRPVSVGCIARGPCQGYVGNTSGTTGIILSMACGRCTCSSQAEHMGDNQVPSTQCFFELFKFYARGKLCCLACEHMHCLCKQGCVVICSAPAAHAFFACVGHMFQY